MMNAVNATSKLNESKRQQILDGARQVFMDNGYAAASMERIAKTAGVSKGTLYNYFENKESLFVCLIQSECGKSEELSAPVRQYSDAPPEPILNQIGQQWLIGLLQPNQRALFRIVLAECMQFPELGQAIERSGPQLAMQGLGQYLAHLNQRGILRIPDIELATEQFFALCDAGITRKMHFSVSEPTEAQIIAHVKSAVTVFLNGYRV
ncbi:TetR/AcrR family transcriptional regulator [Chitinibacter bivalviorum]|uniref:TetR/AcrR family transcriptional regulator n=1 Tax=Chitinibacter bivalviorum TaxID=2739434 RepID=A0A7H9BJZ3_9NEIS|nr:TetR/AcrR family transcriptional regulator [Chitinibacter bivalviorum]QLG88578.1 TetR/AcrR family transcriptional regulator [Chitinibacter bivalviorum]